MSKMDQVLQQLETQSKDMRQIVEILMGMSAVMHINKRDEPEDDDPQPIGGTAAGEEPPSLIGDLHKRLTVMERHVKRLQNQVTSMELNNINRNWSNI